MIKYLGYFRFLLAYFQKILLIKLQNLDEKIFINFINYYLVLSVRLQSKSITFPNSTATYGYAAHNSALMADNQSFYGYSYE